MTKLAPRERDDILKSIEQACCENAIEFCGACVASRPDEIEQIGDALVPASRLNGCASLACEDEEADGELIAAAIRVMFQLAANTHGGLGNFRFGIGIGIGPNTPFFPASYHQGGAPCLTIGFENSDLLVAAFRPAASHSALRASLERLLTERYQAVERLAIPLASALGIEFAGLDTSIAPSLAPEESIVEAFRFAGVEFGSAGTLALCGLVTAAVKSIEVKRAGYCGIMLPVLEDVGLAQLAADGRFGISQILSYASVCGVGVDMIAIPGETPPERIAALAADVRTMSVRLRKPLLIRLLPMAGKRAGELTNINSRYICNSSILPLV